MSSTSTMTYRMLISVQQETDDEKLTELQYQVMHVAATCLREPSLCLMTTNDAHGRSWLSHEQKS